MCRHGIGGIILPIGIRGYLCTGTNITVTIIIIMDITTELTNIVRPTHMVFMVTDELFLKPFITANRKELITPLMGIVIC